MTELIEYPQLGTIEERLDWITAIDIDSLVDTKKFGELFDRYLVLLREVQSYFMHVDSIKFSRKIHRWEINFDQELINIGVGVISVYSITSPLLALQVNESAYESTHTAFGTICK